ncbi:MAG: sensory rhodopsin transducer [Ruminiclostridium sp.]
MYTYSIPDAYWHSKSKGCFPSHESVCVLNAGGKPAHISMTLYFEDREKLEGFNVVVESERTTHIRMDKQRNNVGQAVPMDTPYAIVVRSDVLLTMQYTRMDTSQPEMAIMTTMVKAD